MTAFPVSVGRISVGHVARYNVYHLYPRFKRIFLVVQQFSLASKSCCVSGMTVCLASMEDIGGTFQLQLQPLVSRIQMIPF